MISNTSEVNQHNYFEDTGHLSVSRYKRLNQCELSGLSDWNSPSTAMLVGSYVDAYVEGTLDEFIKEHPEIISSRGPTKGQLKVEFKQAEEICEFIDNDMLIQQFLSGEKQVVMEGDIENIPFKIMMDSYTKGVAISDLKVMRSITDRGGNYYDFITSWGYDIQLACYQEIVYQNTGERLPVYIVAVTKETPINSAIINIPQEVLDSRMSEVRLKINHLYNVWVGKDKATGCGVCNTCIKSRRETPLISLETLQGGE